MKNYVILYLSSKFCSVLSYVISIWFVKQGFINLSHKNLFKIFLHVDLINMLFFSIYAYYCKYRKNIKLNLQDVFRGRKQFLHFVLFCIPAFTSFYKAYLVGFIKITDIAISDMATPFLVYILAFVFLKEKMKLNFLYFLSMACVGFFLSNMNGFTFTISNFNWIFSYILINAFGEIILRSFSKKKANDIQAVFSENLAYFLYGLIFLIISESFSFDLLFNRYTVIISIISFTHHYLIIKASRLSEKIGTLSFLNLSKVIFTILLVFLFMGEFPSILKLIGAFIIFISIVLNKKFI